VVTTADRWQRFRTALRKEVPETVIVPDSHADTDVAAMLREIGIALVEVQSPTQVVRNRLLAIARRYTTKDVQIVVLPTVLIIEVGDGHAVTSSTTATTQLNLAGRVDAIAAMAQAGAIEPVDAVAALAAARATSLRFGPVPTIVGYVITTLGFGMVINPTWASLWGYVLLGSVVGILVVTTRGLPMMSAAMPILAAITVTMLATWFVADAANDGLLRVISPALVATLPGLSLSIGAMELASSAIVAGASRLVYGVTQLSLMVFGVAIGMGIAGRLATQQPSPQMGPWAYYVAILVIGIGLYLYLSAPPGSLPWLIAAVAVALLGQKLGGLFMSAPHAGALGALLATPFAVVAGRIRWAPPTIVMLLAAFWALVPGALSFESLGEAATSGTIDVTSLGITAAAIFSIALGMLVSWSLLQTIGRRSTRLH
jgi:uncharacterized membrane protein YjjP (DUF1212 family)/uncharacterized membrane protein YjjB (DUF3815 family)